MKINTTSPATNVNESKPTDFFSKRLTTFIGMFQHFPDNLMALNQFLTYVLPGKTIKETYGRIPLQLEIKHAEWEKYWAKYDMDMNDAPEPNFEDAIQKKWWKGIGIDIPKLISEIDRIIPRATWNDGQSWKTENAEVDHDVSLNYNDEEYYIEDFRFRTDLTDSTMEFLQSMLELCDRNDWLLMDDSGNLSKPNLEYLSN